MPRLTPSELGITSEDATRTQVAVGEEIRRLREQAARRKSKIPEERPVADNPKHYVRQMGVVEMRADSMRKNLEEPKTLQVGAIEKARQAVMKLFNRQR